MIIDTDSSMADAGRGADLTSGGGRPAQLVRVGIVDDDPLARRALRASLTMDPRIEVVVEARNADEALEQIEVALPDVVLMDMRLAGEDGIMTAFRLAQRSKPVPIVMLTEERDDDIAIVALRAGASGVIPKDVNPAALVRAVVGAARGEAAITRRLTLEVIRRLRDAPTRVTGMRPIQSALTAREWEVLDLLALGRGTEEIAEQLVLATETVRSHIQHILSKLGAHSRAEAVALGEGLREAGRSGGHADPDEEAIRQALATLRREREAS